MKLANIFVPLACGFSALAVPAVHAAEADELRIEPVVSIHHSDDSANTLYQLGRHHQQENRLEEAAAAYRAALEKDPEHIEARNALAAVYFAQKNMAAAVSELQALLQKQPKLSHLHSNLGYIYLQEKNYPAAMSELAEAVVIDPANARAFGNLTLAYERLAAMAKGGSARPATTAEAKATPEAATQAPVTVAPAPAAQPKEATETPAMASTAPKAAPAAAQETGAAVEIANGTRDDALGTRIAYGLRGKGVAIGKMTGLAPYKQHRTVILYRDGYRQAALELSRMFSVPPAVVNNTHARDAGDHSAVRLVLGKTSAHTQVRATASR